MHRVSFCHFFFKQRAIWKTSIGSSPSYVWFRLHCINCIMAQTLQKIILSRIVCLKSPWLLSYFCNMSTEIFTSHWKTKYNEAKEELGCWCSKVELPNGVTPQTSQCHKRHFFFLHSFPQNGKLVPCSLMTSHMLWKTASMTDQGTVPSLSCLSVTKKPLYFMTKLQNLMSGQTKTFSCLKLVWSRRHETAGKCALLALLLLQNEKLM